ncbi:type I polyketide synthase [Catenulispora subtropica]|uniref:Acyl transferase n=1 Tax=Catenulispora subtropica TaxID=450798 RepID=A0ABN2SDZ4_9ACTN
MASEETLRDYLKWATTSLADAQRRLREMEEQSREPVAIIGIGCRFPGGAHDPDSLWELLAAGGDAVAGLPADRGWDLTELRDLESEVEDGAASLSEAGFVYEVGDFDAGFFGISPREAVAMDPQQRLLLETSWEALERAGIDPRSLRGSKTGVFTGAAVSGYGFGKGLDRLLDGHLLTGTASSVVSGRVSYTLGLEGPAVTIDTACSSSLVALHLACQSLRTGECTLALAGGATVLAAPTIFTQFSTQLGLASDGRCKAFGATADGMGVAEGVGMILVERLSDARRNGHPVLAVIRGSAINQDGASNGLTAPNGPSQQRVIRAALANAQLSTADVDVVEAHGTGTTLGDPIEAQALLATYGQDRPADRPMWLGSIKSNIGHLQAAAGVAGVIKMTLALQHGLLPRTLHAEEPSPHIDWTAGNVKLLNEPVVWETGERPRRAGVSGFGMSGTNAHVILEEAPSGAEAETQDPDAEAPAEETVAEAPAPAVLTDANLHAWLVSGRGGDALAAQAGRLREFLLARPPMADSDVAWSLATSRSAFENRAVVIGTGDELTAGLAAITTGQPSGSVVTGVAGASGVGKAVFVFPGQGSQWAGMGRELLAASPVFAARFAECAEALAPFVDWSLYDLLDQQLETADQVQPVLWAMMVSLAAVWQAAGVKPDAVVGHSQGEIAAAVVAGILSLEDGARVVALRSQALRPLAGRGGMLSLALPADAVRERITEFGDRVSVAAVNGASATVVSGEPEALEAIKAAAEAEEIRARIIPVDYASHCAQIDALEAEIKRVLAGVSPTATAVPMISAMSGEWLRGPEADADYWYASLRSPVEFDRAIRTLAAGGHRTFLEISPHPVLTGAIGDTLEDAGVTAPVVAGTLRRDEGGPARLLTSFADAHVRGVAVDWTAVLAPGGYVELPTYAFQHQRYWTQATTDAAVDGTEIGRLAGTEAEARFWAAIEAGDVSGLDQALAIDSSRPLNELLPALAAWRRREQDDCTIADWRYRVSWLPQKTAEARTLSGTWLIAATASEAELTEQCVRTLTSRGAQTVVIPMSADDRDPVALTERITAALAQTPDAEVTGVLSLVSLDETKLDGSPVVTVGVAGLLFLEQALGAAGVGAPLWALTRGAANVTPAEPLRNPLQIQIWGLGRVIGLEHPDRWGGLIDLPPTWDDRVGSRLVAVLADGSEDQVAIRPSGTLIRRLVRAEPRRPRTGTAAATDEAWTPAGTVLVTGATGAIGPRLLDWLGRRHAPHVLIPTRSGPSASNTAALAAKLAEAGTGVTIVSCDLASRDDLAGLLKTWGRTPFPPLTAIIHAANLVHLMPLATTDLEELHVALGAKAAGAVWLDEVTVELGIELEAFILFGSIAATWGGKEHGAYAAGNAFLDALAMDRRARGLTATTVAWGVWDTRDDDEMELPLPEVVKWLMKQGMGFLNPGRALTALEQALADDETFIAVADVDWKLFSPVFSSARSWPLLNEIPEIRQPAAAPVADPAAAGAAGELARRLQDAAPAERIRIVVDVIQGQAAAVLGHASPAQIDPDRAFRDLGFDSLTAIDLRNRLNGATGLTLPSTVVFDYPSATVLAHEIIAQLVGGATAAAAPVAAAASDEPIAIVGMGCRFPGGVATPEQLWELVATGGDAVSGFPANRGWDMAGLFDPDPDNPGTSYVQEGGFLHMAPEFDPAFFGISPREAIAMDPQQRLLLEICWEALERAGIDPDTLRGSATGVFAGASPSGYLGQALTVEGAEGHLITGNITSILSGRVSYTLGLEGPAVTVDTACSSSLVALHLAAQALRSGECTLALAGGVMVMADPAGFVGFSKQRALAADGRCKAFSDDADGMGMGEGAGVLLLERLSDAQRNGHPVLAVVRGSAMNQDGASNGLTAPNGPSQQRVIRAALANAQLTGSEVDVVEAHGTGTALGDPIEAQALLATYGQDHTEDKPLWLGSVKSNIGHAQAAAGVAGIMKMVMALRHATLPRTLHAETPSSHIDWTTGHVRLLNEPVAWPAAGPTRRAGISAFGLSGTNVHVIIEESPGDPGEAARTPAPTPVLAGSDVTAWIVAGRGADALAGQAGRMREFAIAHPELGTGDVAWSLAATRTRFDHRAVVVGKTREELTAGLAAVATHQSSPAVVSGVARSSRVGFLFSGQGAQRAGMGRSLYAASPVFAESFDYVAALLEAELGLPVADVVLGRAKDVDADQTVFAQTGLFAVQVALVDMLTAAGVRPDAVAGHSVGEIAAAWAAGVLSLEDACRLVAHRARLMQSLPEGGAMCSIAATEEEVLETLTERVGIAAVNGPRSVVVSGDAAEVDAVAELWRDRERRVKPLRVSHAFHSIHMDPILDELGSVAAGLEHAPAKVLWAQAASGEIVSETTASYWTDQARGAVRFADAANALAERGVTVFVEIGPDGTLSAIGTAAVPSETGAAFIPLLRSKSPAPVTVTTALARIHVQGVHVDWPAVLGTGRRLDLPTYAFQHQNFWPQVSTTLIQSVGGGASGDTVATAAEGRFWTAVEDGDLAGLEDALAIDTTRPLSELLPALASWRRRERADGAVADWRYRVAWTPVSDPGAAVLSGTWLVVVPAGYETSAQGMLQALAERGAQTVTVQVGPGLPDRGVLTGRLADQVAGPGDSVVSGVLSLLAFDEAPLTEYPAVPSGVAWTVTLAQALGDAGIGAPLWAVTQGAVSTGPGDAPTSVLHAQAQVWGLGRVIGLEHPERWGGLIDLPQTWDERTAARFCSVLAGIGEDQVAVRSTGLQGRRLVRVPQPDSGRWAPGGSVLITGGTGGIGSLVARWAGGRGAERVVLTSRSGATAAGVAALAADLAGSGTFVDVVACDIAQRPQVAGLVNWVCQTGPVLSSVIHAAGVGQGTATADLTIAEQAAVSEVKTLGAVWLDELTEDLDLDAFALFSSVSATWGSGLQPSYAAANAALDALAESRHARGLVGTSVAWGLWAGAGMGAGDAGEQLQRYGLKLMDPELGIRALAQAIDGREVQVTVADVDWERFAPLFTLRRPSPLLELLPEARRALTAAAAEARGGAVAESQSELVRRLTAASRADQERLLIELVRGEAAIVLGHAGAEAVAADQAFASLGFDSVTAMELRNRLNAVTGLTLPATLAFDYPTSVILAEHLRGELLGTGSATAAPVVAAAASDEPIAIVGMGCRLPGGVGGPEQLWDLVTAGTDAISPFPQDRGWEAHEQGLGSADMDYARVGGFVYDAGDFDAPFFGVSPREALAMDPQQRLLLEVSWEALERAGIDPSTLRGTPTGVFAGASSSGYDIGLLLSASGAERTQGHLTTGNAGSVVSGRVAYTLGLEGPAVTIDTACSSSLVALHLACQAIRTGECTMALAGGVTVMATPGAFGDFSKQQGMATDGRCKAFSDDADGTGWAEGAGMILLERLSEAERNGHRVLAVIRGTATNQDGASNGLTAPNGPSQQRVIRAALANAGLTTADVDVVEAHGTGTKLGDPIEAQALLATYGKDRPADRPLWLGTVKSNIGHAQQAAGVSGVIKMVMALRHGVLPRTLHAGNPSTHVDWTAGAVRLLDHEVPWAPGERPRRAGVSAFGMSGTNAHVIVEEAPIIEPADGSAAQEPGAPRVLADAGVPALLVSGRGADALASQAGRLREFVLGREAQVSDVAWSLATTRAAFEHRSVVIGTDRTELAAGLAAVATGQPAAGVVTGSTTAGSIGRSVFVFPGQGSQWAGMGRELLAASPVFAARFAECARALAPFVDWSLYDLLDQQLETADEVQPVLWAMMVSLAAVWQAAGVTPDAVVGHSQGEIAAAVVAGILSLEDGARVVALRSQALKPLAGKGGMLSLALPAAATSDRIEAFGDRVSVAAVNGASATVVSGEREALLEIQAAAEADGVRARMIPVDYASHCAQIDALETEIKRVLAGVTPSGARIPMICTFSGNHGMSGETLAGPEADADYWYASLRSPVEFDRAIRAAAEAGHRTFIEVSPHPVLVGAITDTLDDLDVVAPVVTGTLRRDEGGPARLLTSLAEVHVRGVVVDWTLLLEPAAPIDLPTYAFQHERYWPEVGPALIQAATGGAPADPAEADFWAAVDGGDVHRLAETLAVDGDRLSDVLPALASWRRRERTDSVLNDWRYRITWAPIAENTSPAPEGTWLIVAPAGHETATRNVVQALAERRAETAVVTTDGSGLDRAALAALLTATATAVGAGQEGAAGLPVEAQGAIGLDAIAGVISLTALDENPLPDHPVLATGVAATLVLVQALGDAGIAAPLWVLTRGAVTTGPQDVLTSPTQAQVWGLGRVAGLEHPDRWGGLVDLPEQWDDRAGARLCAIIAGRASGSEEDQVAIRAAGILGRRLVRAPQARTPDPWSPRGTVLVTGGTGGIGGLVARWAAERGAPRLVLTSRSGPSAPDVAESVATLAASGTPVEVVACDVARRDDVAALLAHIKDSGPALSSVVHSAGVGQGTALLDTTVDEQAHVSAAKCAGAAWLDELTAQDDLDAFVTFSSGSAIWGSGLQPAYASANAYLDALAENRRARGLTATSVAWGLWGGVGLAQGDTGEQLQRYGLRVMDPELGIKALARAVDGGDGTITVADVDWSRFAPTFTVHRPSPLLGSVPEARQAMAGFDDTADAGASASASASDLAARLAGLSRAEQDRLLTDVVRAEVAAVLGYASGEAVEAGRPFKDLGVDSVTAVELRNRLNAVTGLKLSSTLVFDYPTSAVLAEHLRARLSPDGAEAAEPVFGELDQLEAVLAGIPADSGVRAEVTARLQTVLSKWLSAQDAPKRDVDTATVTDRLGAASADEVLDFINKEFGMS